MQMLMLLTFITLRWFVKTALLVASHLTKTSAWIRVLLHSSYQLFPKTAMWLLDIIHFGMMFEQCRIVKSFLRRFAVDQIPLAHKLLIQFGIWFDLIFANIHILLVSPHIVFVGLLSIVNTIDRLIVFGLRTAMVITSIDFGLGDVPVVILGPLMINPLLNLVMTVSSRALLHWLVMITRGHQGANGTTTHMDT